MKHLLNVRLASIIVLVASLSISGCAVHFVADYDPKVKEEIVQLSKKVDLFWGKLLETEVKKRKYEKFKEQYIKIETDLRGLVMINKIRALNKSSTRQANILLELWIDDKDTHKKDNTFSDLIIKRHREGYERIFTAMARGEAVKEALVD